MIIKENFQHLTKDIRRLLLHNIDEVAIRIPTITKAHKSQQVVKK